MPWVASLRWCRLNQVGMECTRRLMRGPPPRHSCPPRTAAPPTRPRRSASLVDRCGRPSRPSRSDRCRHCSGHTTPCSARLRLCLPGTELDALLQRCKRAQADRRDSRPVMRGPSHCQRCPLSTAWQPSRRARSSHRGRRGRKQSRPLPFGSGRQRIQDTQEGRFCLRSDPPCSSLARRRHRRTTCARGTGGNHRGSVARPPRCSCPRCTLLGSARCFQADKSSPSRTRHNLTGRTRLGKSPVSTCRTPR